MKGDDIAERLLEFAARIMRLVDALPAKLAGKHVGSQLLRSGTSGGANYEEARNAESRADFIHKLGVARKEVCESSYWLRLIERSGLVKPELVGKLAQESRELAAILTASVKTTKRQS